MKILSKKGIYCYRLGISILFMFAHVIAGNSQDLVRLPYNHPSLIVDLGVGLWAWPLPMDFDGDGDYDLVVSCPDKPFNGIYFFENKMGNVDMPIFEAPVKIHEEGVKNIDISYVDKIPKIIVPGKEVIGLGSREVIFKDLYPKEKIHEHLSKSPRFDQWKYVDFENDGDLDIIVGVDDWGDYGWDNAYDERGNWINGPLHGFVFLIENENGTYVAPKKIKASESDIDVYGAPSPNLADFDNDGDLDLICGEFLDRMTYFQNIGSRTNPIYDRGQYLLDQKGIIHMELQMIVPVSIDWNKDGWVDLIVGEEDGRVAFLRNTGLVEEGIPIFDSPKFFQQKAHHVKFGALITPVSTDWDNDGDEDIIAGNTAGYIGFIENLGGGAYPKWAAPQYLRADDHIIRIKAGSNGSIQGPAEAKWGYTTLTVADWNHDGLLDIVVNSIWGEVHWYENIGSKTQPKLAAAKNIKVNWNAHIGPKPEWFWWNPKPQTLVTQWRTTPYAIDWNQDGYIDLIMLDHQGFLTYFERIEKEGELILKPGQRIFYGVDHSVYDHKNQIKNDTPGILQLNERLNGGSGRRKFIIVDWNQDGLLDFIVNGPTNVDLFLNQGTQDGRVLLKLEGAMAETVLVGHTTSPTTTDWDGDGKRELLIGAEDGFLYYLKPSK